MHARPIGLMLAGGAAVMLAGPARAQCRYTATVIAHYCQPDEISPTIPTAINSQGDVVGYVAICAFGENKPFVWTEQGGLQLLPVPPGTVRCAPPGRPAS